MNLLLLLNNYLRKVLVLENGLEKSSRFRIISSSLKMRKNTSRSWNWRDSTRTFLQTENKVRFRKRETKWWNWRVQRNTDVFLCLYLPFSHISFIGTLFCKYLLTNKFFSLVYSYHHIYIVKITILLQMHYW